MAKIKIEIRRDLLLLLLLGLIALLFPIGYRHEFLRYANISNEVIKFNNRLIKRYKRFSRIRIGYKKDSQDRITFVGKVANREDLIKLKWIVEGWVISKYEYLGDKKIDFSRIEIESDNK